MFAQNHSNNIFVKISQNGQLVITVSFFLLLLVVGSFNITSTQSDVFFIYLSFCVYIASILLPFLLLKKRLGYFHPLVFMLLWWQLIMYILPRLGVFTDGLSYHRILSNNGLNNLNEVVSYDLIFNAIGFLAFALPFFIRKKFPVSTFKFNKPRFPKVKVVFISLLSIFAFYILVKVAGGFGKLMLYRGLPPEARQEFINSLGGRHWHFMVSMLKVACLVWLSLSPKIWCSFFFIFFFILGLSLDYMATGSRGGVVFPVLMAGIIWILYYRKIPYLALFFGALFSLLVVGIGGEFRENSRSASDISSLELNTGVLDGIIDGFENFVEYGTETDGAYAIIGKVPSDVDFLYGESYLSVLLAPIPSAFLPFEKPNAGGKLNAIHIFNNPNTAVPPGNIGESYWNFGVIGILVIMFSFGFFMKYISELYSENSSEGWALLFYVVTLFTLQPNSPEFYNWLHLIVPASIVIFIFCGFPKRTKTIL